MAYWWCSWIDNPVLNGLNVLILVFCVTVRTNVLILFFFRCSLQSVDVFISGLISKCYWCGVWNLQWLLVDIGFSEMMVWAESLESSYPILPNTPAAHSAQKLTPICITQRGFQAKEEDVRSKKVLLANLLCIACWLNMASVFISHCISNSRSYLNVCTFDHLCIFRAKMSINWPFTFFLLLLATLCLLDKKVDFEPSLKNFLSECFWIFSRLESQQINLFFIMSIFLILKMWT